MSDRISGEQPVLRPSTARAITRVVTTEGGRPTGGPPRRRRRRVLLAMLAAVGLLAISATLILAVMDDTPGNDDVPSANRAAGSGPGSSSAPAAQPGAAPAPGASPTAVGAEGQRRSRAPGSAPVALGSERLGTEVAAEGRRTGGAAPNVAHGSSGTTAPTPGAHGEGVGAKSSSPHGRKSARADDDDAPPTRGVGAGGAGGGSGTRSEGRSSIGGDSWRSQQRQQDDGGPMRVARFAPSGGAGLRGQVVDADTAKALSGVVVEAHLEGKFMEAATDANGSFRMVGLLPGKRVKVWTIVKNQAYVAEYVEVQIPDEGETADVGVIRLLHGSELGGHVGGWVGLFMGRRGHKNVVTAVNPWLPADRAGIETGDVILSVDGRNLEGLGPRATGFLLRGPVGTKTSITVQNPDGVVRRVELERVSR